MTTKPIDAWFERQEEPAKGCLLALRHLILNFNPVLTEAWKYGMPFYCYEDKMILYLWTRKNVLKPYIGFVDGKLMKHPALIQEKRARMKIALFEPERDLPVKKIQQLLKEAIKVRKERNEKGRAKPGKTRT